MRIPRPRRGPKMFVCDCGKQFRTLDAFKRHVEKKHPGDKK